MNSVAVLKKYFGFEEFRPLQKEIIDAVLHRKDALVLMPTGGGKSVCFQVPALLNDGLTVVISPLIALMKDQVDALRLNGVDAAFLNSSQSASEQEKILNRLTSGEIKLLYVAPERLFGVGNFYHFLKKIKISLFAIDEAHCISHWGHDFRPDYLSLSSIKKEFSNVPIIALTATADKLTRNDIVEKLKLHNPEIFVSSFNRSNIRYIIEEKYDHFPRLLDFIESRRDESGIIYCLSRNETEQLAEKLVDRGFSAAAYHAGLDSALRSKRQEQFKRDDLKIIVATIAFGMGIDKSNVRYVIHTSVPKNIESYYQETGRAGRDGLPSQALLFYSSGDIMRLKRMIASENENEMAAIMHKKLNQIGVFCSSHVCRRKYLLNYFDEKFDAPCNNCDICLGKEVVGQFDATILAQKALSAVKRLKERFGTTYVINFLKGSASAKIFDEHKYLPTFGKGSDLTSDEWKHYFRQLLEQEYLVQNGEFGSLQITAKGNDVLYKEEKVILVRPREKKVERKERKERYAAQESSLDYHRELFERLRSLRQLIADSENVPAYVVFNDSTLIELSFYLPMTDKDLVHIAGFGKIKIEKYGKEFLSEINKYCAEHNLQSNMGEKQIAKKPKESKPRENRNFDTATVKETYRLYLEGKSLEEIAEIKKVKQSTVEEYLLNYVVTGEINVLKFVNKEKLQRISVLIDEYGISSLKVLKEHADDCSYTEIKATINYLQREKLKS